MKKILFLIHDLGQGGAEKVLINLLNNMDYNKFDITVMTLFDEGVNKQFLSPRIHYKSCFKKSFRGNSQIFKILSPEQLYKLLIKYDYDIVISYLEGPCARIVGGAPDGIKVVSWIHITLPTEKIFCHSFRNMKEAQRCYKRADRLVYVSKNVRDVFQQFCKTDNNLILYNTNLTKEIIEKSLEPVEHNLIPNDTFNWCGVGKVLPNKGFDRLLRIHKKLIDDGAKIHFHILGTGTQENLLKEWCKANKIDNTVTFWGYQINPYNIVANCDLFACASFAEGFSTAATEALIVGTPVCTVDVGGMKEMLGDNNEYGIVTENDEDALYKKIRELYFNRELLNHYKQMAEIRGRDFSTENTVKAVENMLLSI